MFSRWVLARYQSVFRISRWMRVHFSKMGHLCLMLLLVSGAFGVDIKANSTSQLFVFLGSLFILSILNSLFNRFKATIARQLPRYATVGEPLIYTVRIQNKTNKNYLDCHYFETFPVIFPKLTELLSFYQRDQKSWHKKWISFRLWRRFLIHQQGCHVNEQSIQFLPVQQAVSIQVRCTPLRRGRLTFAGAMIAKLDILGLFRRLYFAENSQYCLVLPKRYPIAPLNLSGQRKYQSGGVSLANSVGDSLEFMSLREYRQGDALNQIHWKSFARNGRLIVKEYQDEFFVRRALVLDTYQGQLDHEIFEAAISVAASLAMNEQHNEALLDLMFVGKESYQFTSGRGLNQSSRLQEILASVQASDANSFTRLEQAVHSHKRHCNHLMCVVLHWDQQRQDFFKLLTASDIPLAVFLIGDGSVKRAELEWTPQHFYLINLHQLATDLMTL